MITVRRAESRDHDAIWRIVHEIVAEGTTYPFAPDTTRAEGLRLWVELPKATYVAELDGNIVGTYYLKGNQPGLGSHVCNAGYMVPNNARGSGIGRAMCAHSLEEAKRMGYLAMQYNLVATTNQQAVALWKTMGFEVVGTLPKAFRHATQGLVDAHVMYKIL